jgi:hypothetical protein
VNLDVHWWQRREAVGLAVLLSIMPLLWPAIPPLTDLPGHIGRYRVMLGNDADVLREWYRFEWRLVGNLGVDLLVYALAPLVGLEPAVKAAVIATAALMASGILWITREVHGRITPFAWFALPLAYSFPLQFGFVNYALAVALALNGFALWLRLAGRTGLRAALFVPLACIVWLAHVMGWGALGLMAFGAELARQRETGRGLVGGAVRAAVGCLPLAVPLLLLVLWRVDSGGGMTGEFLQHKLQWLATILRDRWMAWDLASVLLLWALVYLGFRDRRIARSGMLTGVAALFALAYLALPYILFDSTFADMRLAPLVLLFALIAMRPGEAMSARWQRRLALAGLLFFAARTAGTAISFWQYDRSWTRELAALDHVPRGARLVTLVGEQCLKPWGRSRLVHLPGIALARRAAFANDQWPLSGSALLSVTARDMGALATDPSQMVLSGPCEIESQLKPVDVALKTIPRGTFDHLWLVDPPAYDPKLLDGMSPVWRDGSSGLYRIERR